MTAADPDARETALLRGTLDLCVLSLLRDPAHAYEIVARLQQDGFDTVSYGTIYPLTTRLRRLGLLAQQTQTSTSGPNRNVLSLTQAGWSAIIEWERQWRDHSRRVSRVLARTPDSRSASQKEPAK